MGTTNHKLTQLRGLAEDKPEETQVDSIKRTCRRRTVTEESAEVGESWWEVCGRENRKEDWNVPLHCSNWRKGFNLNPSKFTPWHPKTLSAPQNHLWQPLSSLYTRKEWLRSDRAKITDTVAQKTVPVFAHSSKI